MKPNQGFYKIVPITFRFILFLRIFRNTKKKYVYLTNTMHLTKLSMTTSPISLFPGYNHGHVLEIICEWEFVSFFIKSGNFDVTLYTEFFLSFRKMTKVIKNQKFCTQTFLKNIFLESIFLCDR